MLDAVILLNGQIPNVPAQGAFVEPQVSMYGHKLAATYSKVCTLGLSCPSVPMNSVGVQHEKSAMKAVEMVNAKIDRTAPFPFNLQGLWITWRMFMLPVNILISGMPHFFLSPTTA